MHLIPIAIYWLVHILLFFLNHTVPYCAGHILQLHQKRLLLFLQNAVLEIFYRITVDFFHVHALLASSVGVVDKMSLLLLACVWVKFHQCIQINSK